LQVQLQSEALVRIDVMYVMFCMIGSRRGQNRINKERKNINYQPSAQQIHSSNVFDITVLMNHIIVKPIY